MEKAEVEKYERVLMETAYPWVTETDKDVEWTHHSGTNVDQGIVYKARVPKYGTIFKAQVVLECSAEAGFHAIAQEKKNSWMPNLGVSVVLEDHKDWHVAYQTGKGMCGVSDRELYAIRFHRKFSEGLYAEIACSIAKVPKYDFTPPPNKVRCENLPGGLSWRQLSDPNKCLFTHIYNLDLKGYIPKYLVNMVSSIFLDQFTVEALKFSRTIERPKQPISDKENGNKNGKCVDFSSKKASVHSRREHLLTASEQ